MRPNEYGPANGEVRTPLGYEGTKLFSWWHPFFSIRDLDVDQEGNGYEKAGWKRQSTKSRDCSGNGTLKPKFRFYLYGPPWLLEKWKWDDSSTPP